MSITSRLIIDNKETSVRLNKSSIHFSIFKQPPLLCTLYMYKYNFIVKQFVYSRVGNTKHEKLVFRVYRYKHENPKSKHATNTKKVETRNKHEKLGNLHIILDFLSSIIVHCVLTFHPFILKN